jgi:RES domain-containing protein
VSPSTGPRPRKKSPLRRIRRGGDYVRVADPAWGDPLDGSYAAKKGGRWNPPDSFPVVYLNGDWDVARANVRRKYRGLPYGPESIDPAEAPILVQTNVAMSNFVDIITDVGCEIAGLPTNYPNDDGAEVPWSRCRPVGVRAWEEGAPGIACRSAAVGGPPYAEELAWFEREDKLSVVRTYRFEDWYYAV